MRDWFTFHQGVAGVTNRALWRVRAVRQTYGTTQNAQTAASYGPWSPVLSTSYTRPTKTGVALGSTVSTVIGTTANPVAHPLMPGFSWSGDLFSGVGYELYRVYVFSDSDCVQPVFTGSIVGSPAWAPRLSGPLLLPASDDEVAETRAEKPLLKDGDQSSNTYDATHTLVSPNETSASSSSGSGSAISSSTWLDLWDRKWPGGAYYWTVVPVTWFVNPLEDNAFEYQDIELPQDVCAAGRVGAFGKASDPIPTANKKAYVTGLSLSGRMTSASASLSPRFYGTPLVAWTPVIGADSFEVQWSRTRYPWRTVGTVSTPSTSAVLPLKPGVWYYRVRGIDLQMPSSSQGMAWSSVRTLRIAKPVFRVA